MELTIKITLDDRWEAYHVNNESRLENLIPCRDGVEIEIIEPKIDDSLITIDWLMIMHRELTPYQAALLLRYCNDNTIMHKECYGNGEMMFNEWKKLQL